MRKFIIRIKSLREFIYYENILFLTWVFKFCLKENEIEFVQIIEWVRRWLN
jgi:hypothetical protein